jgi:hypothetical protein
MAIFAATIGQDLTKYLSKEIKSAGIDSFMVDL